MICRKDGPQNHPVKCQPIIQQMLRTVTAELAVSLAGITASLPEKISAHLGYCACGSREYELDVLVITYLHFFLLSPLVKTL